VRDIEGLGFPIAIRGFAKLQTESLRFPLLARRKEKNDARRLRMALEKTSIFRLLLLSASVLGVLGSGTKPLAAQTPASAVLITLRGPGEHGLQIADPQTMKVVATVPIPGGGEAHEVAVSPDGKLAFVTTTNFRMPQAGSPEEVPGRDFISVIDLTTQKELRRVQTGMESWPHGIVYVGGKVYFTAEGYMTVGCYDPATDHIEWMLGTAQNRTHMLVFSKDTKRIFTASTDSNTVTVIGPWEPPANYHKDHYGPRPIWGATQIPVGRGPEGIAITPDGKEVWVLNRGEGTASIIDTASLKVVQTFDLNTKVPVRLQFTPDGKRVVISDLDSGTVMILDAVARKEIKRIELGSRTHGVLISPDGSHAYVTELTSKRVAVIDLNKLELTGHILTGTEPENMAWAQRK
jgi:YVTN family beta-propeller protein